MKKTNKVIRHIVPLLCAAVIIFAAGCSAGNDEDEVPTAASDAANAAQTIEQKDDDVTDDGIKTDAVIMVVGDADITYSEVVVYILMLKQQYEPVFTSDIWNFMVSDDENFEDMAKEEIINQIARLKIMGFEAESLGASLNADEKLDIEDDAVEFLQQITMEDQEKYGITRSVVENIYTDNYLAQKVFDVVTADVDTSVSDEEAAAVNLKQIKIVFNGTDKDGKLLTGTDEEKQKALERIDTIYEEVVTQGKDFSYYAEKYSDAADEELTLIRGDMEQAVEDAAFSLTDNQYSGVVEGENAYYILYCVKSNDTSNLAQNKEKIISRRQDDVFNELYSEWIVKYDTFIVTGLWNMISFKDL